MSLAVLGHWFYQVLLAWIVSWSNCKTNKSKFTLYKCVLMPCVVCACLVYSCCMWKKNVEYTQFHIIFNGALRFLTLDLFLFLIQKTGRTWYQWDTDVVRFICMLTSLGIWTTQWYDIITNVFFLIQLLFFGHFGYFDLTVLHVK